jgi:DNA-directed RNA polymerase subunit RPC12/RpoP
MKWKPTTVKAGLVVVLGLLIIGLTVWRTHPGRQKRPIGNYAKAQFMHCPECRAEMRFDEKKLEAECPQCGAEKGMVATEESATKAGTKSRYGRMVAFVMPELCLFLTALWFVLKPRPDAENDEYRYMRCANCSQKLRYRTTQVGAPGACSRCKRAFLFPEGTQREEDLDGATVNG